MKCKVIFNFLKTPLAIDKIFGGFALLEPKASIPLTKEVELKPYCLEDQRVNADFALTLAESEKGMRIQLNYNKALFHEKTMRRFLNEYQKKLEEII